MKALFIRRCQPLRCCACARPEAEPRSPRFAEFTGSTRTLPSMLVSSWMSMLHFGKYNGKYDIAIKGLGIDALVSEIAQQYKTKREAYNKTAKEWCEEYAQ